MNAWPTKCLGLQAEPKKREDPGKKKLEKKVAPKKTGCSRYSCFVFFLEHMELLEVLSPFEVFGMVDQHLRKQVSELLDNGDVILPVI